MREREVRGETMFVRALRRDHDERYVAQILSRVQQLCRTVTDVLDLAAECFEELWTGPHGAQALTRVKFAMLRPLERFTELERRAREALTAVGMADRAGATVRHLSHGEQRQLEIALALAGRPRVLLLDEPAAGLSQAEAQQMTRLLRGLDPAITLLIIEHDMDIALEVARQVTVLHYGRVIADGTREVVRADPTVREIYLGA